MPVKTKKIEENNASLSGEAHDNLATDDGVDPVAASAKAEPEGETPGKGGQFIALGGGRVKRA